MSEPTGAKRNLCTRPKAKPSKAKPSKAKPARPALRYHGGKWRLAAWIISHFPQHRCYVEPYGGAASVLLRKAPAHAEVYNDLSGEVVNFFRVLRDPEQSRALGRQLRLTPFSREEFEHAWDAVPAEHPAPDVERARRLLVRSYMGFSTMGATVKLRSPARTGFRASAHRQGKVPAHNWKTYADAVPAFTRRLDGVVIERRDALEVIRQQDRPHTLFYLDPPYLPGVRGERWQEKAYSHEMNAAEHEELAALLREIDGMVILSGYASELYRDCYEAHGWTRRERSAHADGARERIECLWLNPAAQEQKPQQSLFPT